MKILIVDDNPTNLKLASEVLACEGYVVESAEDAERAQEMLRHSVPDLILMDIALPGMDGLTLARLLKGDPAYQHVRIVALTAFAMTRRRARPAAMPTSPNRSTRANCPCRWQKSSNEAPHPKRKEPDP